MSNFKSGSGNLDFGGNNKNDKGDTTDESASSTSQGDNIDEEEVNDTPETEQQSSTPTKPDGNDESARPSPTRLYRINRQLQINQQ